MVMEMKQKKNVYIVGAGKFGKAVLQIFEEYGKSEWNVLGFLDNDTLKQGNTADGYPVLSIQSGIESDKMQELYVFIAVTRWEMKMELVSQLIESRYEHIYLLKTSVYFQRNVFFKDDKVDFKYATEVKMAEDGKMMPIFMYLETHVMDGCNLKCKGCTHFSNLFSTEADVPLEKFEDDMVRLQEICNIEKIRLLGGEPLLNKDLLNYIKIVKRRFPYSDIHIVTNGLLIPEQGDTLLSYMRENEIVFDISWYPPTINMREKILEFLAYKGVKYCAPNEKIQDFSRCLTLSACHDPAVSHERCDSGHCTILRNGKLYKCPLAAYMPEYKRAFGVGIEEDSGVDIYHDSIGRIREFSVDCIKKPIDMCRYCTEQPQTYLWSVSPKPEMEDWIAD